MNEQTPKSNELPDDLNPLYLFSGTFTDLLVQITHGQIDCVELAEMELANRGLDIGGRWVGFPKKRVCEIIGTNKYKITK